MKKLIFLLSLVGLGIVSSAWAYYTEDCTYANNYCGGGVNRCDLYCRGTNIDNDYCTRNCGNWNRYTSTSSCYYDSWGTYRCDGTNYTYSYANYSGVSSNCRYDGSGFYRCDTQAYPYWFPASRWWWSQDDLDLMTQSLNSDAIASAKRPDFFETKVIRKDNNWKRLNAIAIKNYSFSASDMQEKQEDSKKFIGALKDAIWQRYTDGVIKNYQMADIIRDLGDTVYALNGHFGYASQYEKTKKDLYNELAMEKLDEVKMNYDRLKGSLKWR